MKIELLTGYHLTQTERASIKKVIESGHTFGRNKPNTKTYSIEKGWADNGNWHYTVKVGTFGTFTIGAAPRWDYQTVNIKTDKKLNP